MPQVCLNGNDIRNGGEGPWGGKEAAERRMVWAEGEGKRGEHVKLAGRLVVILEHRKTQIKRHTKTKHPGNPGRETTPTQAHTDKTKQGEGQREHREDKTQTVYT